jgi:hypothetical protein
VADGGVGVLVVAGDVLKACVVELPRRAELLPGDARGVAYALQGITSQVERTLRAEAEAETVPGDVKLVDRGGGELGGVLDATEDGVGLLPEPALDCGEQTDSVEILDMLACVPVEGAVLELAVCFQHLRLAVAHQTLSQDPYLSTDDDLQSCLTHTAGIEFSRCWWYCGWSAYVRTLGLVMLLAHIVSYSMRTLAVIEGSMSHATSGSSRLSSLATSKYSAQNGAMSPVASSRTWQITSSSAVFLGSVQLVSSSVSKNVCPGSCMCER